MPITDSISAGYQTEHLIISGLLLDPIFLLQFHAAYVADGGERERTSQGASIQAPSVNPLTGRSQGDNNGSGERRQRESNINIGVILALGK